jgi:two-component system, LytTR family, response regulator
MLLKGILSVQQEGKSNLLERPDRIRIRSLIVDADPAGVERLREILLREPEIEVIGACADGMEAVSMFRTYNPDLIFLDPHISGMDGFSVLEHLRGGTMPLLVFVTAYDSYALKAFEFSAVDYVLKPFTPERVRKAIRKVRAVLQKDDRIPDRQDMHRLAIKSGKKVFFLKTSEIDWIEAEGNSVRLHSGPESHSLKMSITSLEQSLDPAQFVRIHRSTIVNVERVRWLEPSIHGTYRVILHDGTQLVMSRKEKLPSMTGKTIKSELE